MLEFWLELSLTKVTLNKSAYKVVKNITDDDVKHYIGKSTFRIGFGIHDNVNLLSSNTFIDETYFNLSMYHQEVKWINDVPETYITELESGPCSESDLPNLSAKVYHRMNFSNYICLKSDDYYLQSDGNGDSSATVYITLQKCN